MPAKNIEIVDANIILRYLLKDEAAQFKKAKEVVEKQKLFIPFEVGAEIVYVLQKVYNIPKDKIVFSLSNLISYDNISAIDEKIFKKALQLYNSENIDFVDSLLISYNHLWGSKIHSFDKKLNKLCE